jgi:hypothetical protein
LNPTFADKKNKKEGKGKKKNIKTKPKITKNAYAMEL